jgi:hypothetical protein
MVKPGESLPESISSLAVSSSSTVEPPPGRYSSTFDLAQKQKQQQTSNETEPYVERHGEVFDDRTSFEKSFNKASNETYTKMNPASRKHFSHRLRALFTKSGKLRPFRLLRQDTRNIRDRYVSDWTLFNQLVFASAVYVFFANILPGITFASDLDVLTGMTWGTIEVVFSTGLCGIIFAL